MEYYYENNIMIHIGSAEQCAEVLRAYKDGGFEIFSDKQVDSLAQKYWKQYPYVGRFFNGNHVTMYSVIREDCEIISYDEFSSASNSVCQIDSIDDIL